MTKIFGRLRATGLSCNVLKAGVAGMAVAIAAPVWAQDTTPQDTSTQSASSAEAPTKDIVVSGYRQSVDNAIRVKKLSIAVVETVNAEDVGKLPTNSITDALSQLPGVTAQRLDGRSDVLAVRGFGPNFTTTLFNGREIATIADDRGFQYDQIPAELINRADVIKTAAPDMIAQGVAGTVNMMTIDPLAQNHRILTVSGKFEGNAYSKAAPDVTHRGYRVTGIYVDKFADDTIGVALGGTLLSSPQQERQYENWGFPTDASGTYLPGGAKYFTSGNVQTRQSVFGSLKYRPNEKLELSFDGFYSHFRTVQQQRGLEVPMSWGSGTLGATTVSNGVATQATYTNEYAVQRNNYNQRNARTLELGGNAKYNFSETLHLNVDASYSRAHRRDTNLETYTGTCYNAYTTKSPSCQPSTITATQQPNGIYSLTSSLNYANPTAEVLTDPLGWGYNGTSPVVQAGFLNAPDYVDEIKALRTDLEKDLGGGFFKSIKAGVSYSVRSKTAGFKSYFLTPGATNATTQLAIPSSILLPSVTPYGFAGQTLAYDPLAAAGLLTSTFDNRPQSTTRDWLVREKVWSGYIMANIDSVVSGVPLKGNIGVQIVNTNQYSTGNSAFLSSTGAVTYSPAYGGAKYTYVLPSFTLKGEVMHNAFVVVSASQSMSRSEQGYEAVPFQISYNTTTGGNAGFSFSGTGGQPALRPYLSTNFDLSLQKYFANGSGLISVSAFYKNLTNFVDPVGSYVTTISPAAAAAISGGAAANNQVLVTVPNNGGRGYVSGFEFQAELPFSAFSRSLDGFGLRLNGTHNISSVSFAPPGGGVLQTVTVPGLSAWTGVVTGYYEKHGLSLRSTYQYRSSFLGLSTTVEQAQSYNITRGEGLLSAQIGYEFQNGPMKGLSVTLTGSNLTNAPFENYYQMTKLPLKYETYGATYSIGASYKF
ncbi:TonB-dependent receptor [Novosphingobium rosa]|uniref:TonB-dependent receptor n=1 Tax=Novosphingobium rosa TaxID=76978 RepID=UPI00082AEDA1|nr:TonB-dependent receptor [Novosphingobium rosa]